MTAMSEQNNTTIQSLALLAAASLAITACSDPEVPVTPYPPPGGTASATATAPPPPPPVPSGQPAGAAACDGNTTVALQDKLRANEATYVKAGMKPESTFTCKMLQQGESANVPMTAQPGTCYTIVAVSNPNVSELDVVLGLAPGAIPPALAAFAGKPEFFRDGMNGPTAVIGPKPHCVTNFLPIPAALNIKVTATGGAGPVAVQLYSKPGT